MPAALARRDGTGGEPGRVVVSVADERSAGSGGRGGTAGGRCLAMWSGPRNLSTAMMRAWENRADTVVVDEPFYAHFLDATGLDHPMAAEVIAAGDTDWRRVAAALSEPPESGYFYQKHITTHWLPHFTVDWLDALDHAFLIREPEPVVASYLAKRGGATAADLGYAQQAALFEAVTDRRGTPPPVIDGTRFLSDPEGQLRTLCERLDVPFDAAMLVWPPGARASDGVWGAHWYGAVRDSRGFGEPRAPATVALEAAGQRLADACRPFYEALARHAI